MARLIKRGTVQVDTWRLLGKDEPVAEDLQPSTPIIVHVATWLAQAARLAERPAQHTGVWLDSDDEPEAIAAYCRHLPLIAVNFPVFTDGRGYSIGRLLRDRFAFEGELRAIGDVLVDQVFYLKRCGFDAFALREDKDPAAAIAALSSFSVTYQAATDEPQPLFRRR